MKKGIIIFSLLAVPSLLYVKLNAWNLWKRKEFALSSTAERAMAPGAPPDEDVFSQEERALVEQLSVMIIPSDELGPGAADADVAARIERTLAANVEAARSYKEGLRSIESLAQARFGRSFLSLPRHEQHVLVGWIDEANERMSRNAQTWMQRARRKVHYLYYRHIFKIEPMAGFWKVLTNDVFVQFYSSQVAWKWLGYDGPPFPRGYVM